MKNNLIKLINDFQILDNRFSKEGFTGVELEEKILNELIEIILLEPLTKYTLLDMFEIGKLYNKYNSRLIKLN